MEYYLGKLDLSTGAPTIFMTGEHVAPPMLYDATAKLIICAGTGGFKVFSAEGEVLHTPGHLVR